MVRAPVPDPFSSSCSLTHTSDLIQMYICVRDGWLANSYAVPKEVGKVGVQSPTFIEPVQKRKDGIEAMFSRQTKAAHQSTSRETPHTAASAGSGKRKRESSLPTEEKEEETETGTPVSTSAASSPTKRPKVKKDPIKHEDTVDSEEGNSDIEILLSGPSSPPSQQSVGHPRLTDFLTYERCDSFFFADIRKRMKHVDQGTPSQRRRKRKMRSPHPRVRSSRSSSK